MNRFASGPWKHGFGFRPPVNIDSAPQSFVTVCMIFSCSPESFGQAPSDSSAVDPFRSAAAWLCRTVLMNTAPLSQAIHFVGILSFLSPDVNRKRLRRPFFVTSGRIHKAKCCFLVILFKFYADFYDSFSNSRLTFFYNNIKITAVGFASVHQSNIKEVYKWTVYFMTVISIFCGKN